MSPLPPGPWHTVSVDFCGPFPIPSSHWCLLEISRCGDCTFHSSEEHHHQAWSNLCNTWITKCSQEWQRTTILCWGIQSLQNQPPKGHPIVATSKRGSGKLHEVCSAHAEGRDWRKGLYQFLLNYCATPHITTGISPAELLFKRKIATKLPVLSDECHSRDVAVWEKDKQAKQMKEYADRRSWATERSMAVGETVLAQQKKRNKFSTRFDPSPYQVVDVKAVRNGKYLTRNSSHFKKVNPLATYIT